MRSTTSRFMELVQPTEDMILTEALRLKGNDLLTLDGSTAWSLNYSNILDTMGFHFDIRGSQYLSMIGYTLLTHPTVKCDAPLPTHITGNRSLSPP